MKFNLNDLALLGLVSSTLLGVSAAHDATRVRASVEDRHSTTEQQSIQRSKVESLPIRSKQSVHQRPRATDALDEAMEAVMEESKSK